MQRLRQALDGSSSRATEESASRCIVIVTPHHVDHGLNGIASGRFVHADAVTYRAECDGAVHAVEIGDVSALTQLSEAVGECPDQKERPQMARFRVEGSIPTNGDIDVALRPGPPGDLRTEEIRDPDAGGFRRGFGYARANQIGDGHR
jgi:hypothetical protein